MSFNSACLHETSIDSFASSAVNSDDTSGRSFTAFQNVAKTLNGTAVGQSSPTATTTTDSGALSVRAGGGSVILGFVATFLFSLL